MSAMQVDADEFAKNPELKSKDLQELKSWLATQEHLPPISGTILSLTFLLLHVGSSALIKKGKILLIIFVH
jgi:hypothetical protein